MMCDGQTRGAGAKWQGKIPRKLSYFSSTNNIRDIQLSKFTRKLTLKRLDIGSHPGIYLTFSVAMYVKFWASGTYYMTFCHII